MSSACLGRLSDRISSRWLSPPQGLRPWRALLIHDLIFSPAEITDGGHHRLIRPAATDLVGGRPLQSDYRGVPDDICAAPTTHPTLPAITIEPAPLPTDSMVNGTSAGICSSVTSP